MSEEQLHEEIRLAWDWLNYVQTLTKAQRRKLRVDPSLRLPLESLLLYLSSENPR